MYGFSTRLTSIASPKACIDQREVPPTKRQLKAEVLSAAIEASSLPRYAETGCSRRIGNFARQSSPEHGDETRRHSPRDDDAAGVRLAVEPPVGDGDGAQLGRTDGAAGAIGMAEVGPANRLDRAGERRRGAHGRGGADQAEGRDGGQRDPHRRNLL